MERACFCVQRLGPLGAARPGRQRDHRRNLGAKCLRRRSWSLMMHEVKVSRKARNEDRVLAAMTWVPRHSRRYTDVVATSVHPKRPNMKRCAGVAPIFSNPTTLNFEPGLARGAQ